MSALDRPTSWFGRQRHHHRSVGVVAHDRPMADDDARSCEPVRNSVQTDVIASTSRRTLPSASLTFRPSSVRICVPILTAVVMDPHGNFSRSLMRRLERWDQLVVRLPVDIEHPLHTGSRGPVHGGSNTRTALTIRGEVHERKAPYARRTA
jgi:hypothetical protein